MNLEALKLLREPRSCRSYKNEQIADAELEAVLEAGTYAPTGRGAQSPVIVAVQDRETIGRLRRMNAAIMGNPDADPFYGAPTVLVVLADKSLPTHVYDGACVMCNLLNAAHAAGLPQSVDTLRTCCSIVHACCPSFTEKQIAIYS